MIEMERSTFKTYPQALEYLRAKLDSRKFDPAERYIVLTPDRYTQTVENALFMRRGALDCDVLTLSRLSRKVVPDELSLSREGGVMITSRAVSACERDLGYYARAAKFDDFSREVYSTLLQISASDADVTRATAGGVTASKLRDLAVIRGEYDRIKAEYRDASDRITNLMLAVPHSELIRSAHVYAIGYSVGNEQTTRLNMRLLQTIAHYAKSFEFLQTEPPEPRESMTVFGAPDCIAQYKEVAARIRDKVDNTDLRYGDIYVICPRPRALSRILKEYGIEFYTDEAVSLADTPPLAALDCVYRLKTAPDSDGAIALALNPFSGCDRQDAQMLLNYFSRSGNVFGVFGAQVKDDGARRALAHIKRIADAFCGGFSAAVKSVMDLCGFVKVQERTDAGGTDKITPILSLLELSERYGSGDFNTDARAFFAAAKAVEVKSLPRKRDRVTVTTPATLRLAAPPVLFITDFNEGVLPAATTESGLLTDAELKDIGSRGVVIEPTVFDSNRRERTELKAVVANSGEVFCAYSTGGGAQRSSFISELSKKTVELGYANQSAMLLHDGEDKNDDLRYLTLYACTEGAAREIAARSLSVHAPSIDRAVGKSECVYPPFVPEVGGAALRELSVTQLSNWFKCPYKRFLRYAVGVRERKTDFGAPDFGTVVHAFMEKFMQDPDTSREHVARLADAALTEAEIELDAFDRERLIDDAVDFARQNLRIVAAGGYAPRLYEYEFCVDLPYAGGAVPFKGKIDRIDVCGDYARIVDYKTGSTKFDLGRCLDGTDMQLPLYAYAYGADRVTGMFYIKLAPRYNAEKFKPLSGTLISDHWVMRDYDAEVYVRADIADGYEPSEYFSAAIKNDRGEYKSHGKYSAPIPREKFYALIDRCYANAVTAAGEIASGYIERTPAGNACEYCAYGGICGARKIMRGEEDGDDGI